ncbi:type II methionyl aminopeptidase, partial [Candidatus Bathyarchaeota archaeon]|nr:type II methionyl aminopeptidase [Candidatus Bathyarchaeota archaeon]
VREKTPVIEICEKAEKLIIEKGAKPAFPCNVSINDVAAHYTSPPNDPLTIPEGSLVKVDVGAHIDGYVVDTAVTLCFNSEYSELVKTAEKALQEAIEVIRPGLSTSALGSLIERTIKTRGFKPISNLTGHQVGRYMVHAGTSLPNVAHLSFTKLKLGGAYAIEPFVTLPDAVGKVEDGEKITIFRLLRPKKMKNPHARKLLQYIEENFKTLPFAMRWVRNVIPREHFNEAFQELFKTKAIMGYPIFIEASRKPVAQAEHTVLVVEDGCIVLT